MRICFREIDGSFSIAVRVVFLLVAASVSASTAAYGTQAVLRGTVVDSLTREPVPEARVIVSPLGLETMSSEQGIFEIGPLRPGEYEIQFEAHRYAPRAFSFMLDSLAMLVHDLGRIELSLADSMFVVLYGTVRSPDTGLVAATVSVNGHVVGVTGLDGTFEGTVPVPIGLNTLQIRALSFAPTEELVWFSASDSLVAVDVTLRPFPVRLADMIVEAQEGSGKLSLFHRNRQSEAGSFLYGEALNAVRRFTVTDLLENIPGVRVLPGANTVRLSRVPSTPGCFDTQPQFFVDGRPLRLGPDVSIDNVLEQNHVIAVEVYNGPARIPIVYNRGDASCAGVIALWTRD